MTTNFYNLAFEDHTLSPLIRDFSDPHAIRFANWISEKVGNDNSWTEERQTRDMKEVRLAGGRTHVVHDRSSAHAAAWYSPKREKEKVGQHFKLDDCRVWMRLHFWALKKAGINEVSPSFAEFYVRFIAHFVKVYEAKAPPFAREAYRWSDSKINTDRYMESRKMDDVIGKNFGQSLQQLPECERQDLEWPYYLDKEGMIDNHDDGGGMYGVTLPIE